MDPRNLERVAAALDLRRRGSDQPIENELREERASALSRGSTRLRDALRRIAEHGADEARLQAAADAAFALIVQREALGLHDGEALLDFYAVPGAVRARIGRWAAAPAAAPEPSPAPRS
jgi:hypothetical protein